MSFSIPPPSREENYLANYFDERNILYEREVWLEFDNGVKKRVDFYLTNLDVYVEYFGWYNKSKTDRNRYEETVKLYLKSGVPSVFLYPHELGFLDYAFHTKVVKVLKLPKFEMRKELFKYRLNRYTNKIKSGNYKTFIISLYLFAILRMFETGLKDEFLGLIFIVLIGLMVISLFGMLRDVWRYFYKDR